MLTTALETDHTSADPCPTVSHGAVPTLRRTAGAFYWGCRLDDMLRTQSTVALGNSGSGSR